MAPINTCVLGTGLSGLTFQIPFVLALPDLFTLHSVLERNPSSEGGRVKERFGVTTKIHRSLEDVLADSEIELVIVGTPNATHFEYAKRALGAGKHVLVEKPVVTTVAEARELGELAKSKNLVLYAYQNRRWDSDFLAVKRLLREPTSSHNSLGDLVEFESHFDRYRMSVKGTWKDENLPGAGQLFDLGTHLLDQIVSIFGRPGSVTGFVENIRGVGHPEVDDTFSVILRYPTSESRKYPLNVLARAHIVSARNPQLRYVIRGTKGTLIKYGLDVQEDQLKAIVTPQDIFAEDFGKEPESTWAELDTIDDSGNITKQRWPTTEAGSYVELFKNLAEAIREDKEPAVKWSEVTNVIEIIEAARKSSKGGRTVNLV
ncbi:hypothetical protein PNOK_0343100 [Pyrrhoderma noxium]|uniref:Oxidoreductase n=1 Tax=Pyrrhoderma noxium TaxID=2282107 RepID=A0A286UMS8_9AGAM|nr:hypothetical protein PNOK_0343100 [Pyrrhoderma noxium]